MTVRIAKNSGFCFGVKRAIRLALEASKEYPEIVTLGPIIHNPQMVHHLEKHGITHVNHHDQISNRPTIIRSHGIRKDIYDKLVQDKITLINATCPYVSKAQQWAAKLSEGGYDVLIMGDKNHPEVIALRSYVGGNNYVAMNYTEIPKPKFDRLAVISQTTRTIEDFQQLVSVLVPKCNELRIINTICSATSIRQNATVKLAKESNVMIVIGGKKSSNTKMLAKISEKYIETHHIETDAEIRSEWFLHKKKIGITAGASTPDWVIVEVYNKIIDYLGNQCQKVKRVDEIPGFKED